MMHLRVRLKWPLEGAVSDIIPACFFFTDSLLVKECSKTNPACEDEPKLAFFRCRRNKPDCQTCWGIKSLPWHHVITVNITRHPDSCFKGLSGITGCSYKTINSHLNVPSSLLFWASFHFFKPLSSHNPSLSLINSSLLPWAPLIYSAAECC